MQKGVRSTQVPEKALGAHVSYLWKSDLSDDPSDGYISFGVYDDDAETGLDSFGQHDDTIFFYATPDEFPSLCLLQTSKEDFYVTYYEFDLG